jgi:hypothetical protein
VPTLACYLLREDGQWYDLGEHHHWHATFAVFPGGVDGSLMLGPEDVPVLALRLEGYGYEVAVLERLATDIVRWANEGKNPRATWIDDARRSFKFRTELDPEHPPDGPPSPITGRFSVPR